MNHINSFAFYLSQSFPIDREIPSKHGNKFQKYHDFFLFPKTTRGRKPVTQLTLHPALNQHHEKQVHINHRRESKVINQS